MASRSPIPAPRPLRQDRALDTLGRIMDGARDAQIAAPKSPAELTEVARYSRVSRGVVQRYFPTPESVLAALFRRYTARRLEEYRAMLETLPEDASLEEVCATTIMAGLRAGTGQPLGPVSQSLLALGVQQARRHGRPLARAIAVELHGFLARRNLLRQGEPSAELVLATSLAIAEGFDYAVTERPELLADPATARRFVEWLHQSLFPWDAATTDAPPPRLQ